MRQLLRGTWVAAILTGVIVFGIGHLISRLLEAPSWINAICLIAALIAALVAGFVIDKGKNMQDKATDAHGASDEQPAFIKVRDSKNVKIIGNSVPKGAPLLDAERTTGLFLKGNKQRD